MNESNYKTKQLSKRMHRQINSSLKKKELIQKHFHLANQLIVYKTNAQATWSNNKWPMEFFSIKTSLFWYSKFDTNGKKELLEFLETYDCLGEAIDINGNHFFLFNSENNCINCFNHFNNDYKDIAFIGWQSFDKKNILIIDKLNTLKKKILNSWITLLIFEEIVNGKIFPYNLN